MTQPKVMTKQEIRAEFGPSRHRSHHLRRSGKPGKSGRCYICHFSGCQCPSGVKTLRPKADIMTPKFKWSGFANLREQGFTHRAEGI